MPQPNAAKVRSGARAMIAAALPDVQIYETATKEQADLEALRFPSVVLSVPGWRRVSPEETGQPGRKTIVYSVVMTLLAREYRTSTGAEYGCEEMEDAVLSQLSSRLCVLSTSNATVNLYLRPLRRDTVIFPPTSERGGRCAFVLTFETTEAFL